MAETSGTSSKQVEKSIQDITEEMSNMTLLSFRKIDEVKKLARHFQSIISNPLTQQTPQIHNYLKNLNELHKKIYLQKREGVEVEYIFASATKSNLQRQRFNSLPVSEVSELLKTEFPANEAAEQTHICIDCNVEIELNNEEPLMESLQRHFNLEVHLPKLKRESIDVAEPFVLPNMSRRLSALVAGDTSNVESIVQFIKPSEKVDRLFLAKLEASLIRYLPDNSENSINNAVKFYQEAYDKLCQEIAGVDFSALTGTVAPIIMSIKDNINQNFATDANKNFENDEGEQSSPEKPIKNQIKKNRYYGPIENIILQHLTIHKLLPLIDDRTGKPAFFCVVCEYYTLRFRYDSVLNHVFSETHIHNLSCILQADRYIPFITEERTIEKIKEVNKKFLLLHSISEDDDALYCGLCKVNVDTPDGIIIHLLDENHLSKLSDKIYHNFKSKSATAPIPEDWGQKNLDWAKYLAGTGKALMNRDNVIIENFIKPSGKIANYCPCCDTTLKGPRQILFNHIRQKKHLRNAAPFKLAKLYKNYARPAEYYAGFGNYFICAICPGLVAQASFGGIIEHIESEMHIETIAKLIRTAMYPEDVNIDKDLLVLNKINVNHLKCEFCDVEFQDMHDAILHVLSSVQHQNALADVKYQANKGDIISIYMKGNYILHCEGSTFTCTICEGVFNSLRSLLTHLIFAEHFKEKPNFETVFRFYLELKHNANLLARNKYIYKEFGKLKCGVCDAFLDDGENAKKHVGNIRHRENMGASYVNVNLDVSATE